MPSAIAASARWMRSRGDTGCAIDTCATQPVAEERALAPVGAVDELIDQHEGAGRQFLLERAAGRQRDEVGDAGALEHVDIGAVVDVGRRQPMPLVVARQEHDRQAGDLADAQRRRRLAPGAR